VLEPLVLWAYKACGLFDLTYGMGVPIFVAFRIDLRNGPEYQKCVSRGRLCVDRNVCLGEDFAPLGVVTHFSC
jgi:hypothetical protein